MSQNKKLTVNSEFVYAFAIVLIAFSVAMVAASNFGVSMIVAPAYILSQKLSFLTFGQSEYIIQSILFIAFCIIMKKPKVVYLFSFLTCLIYGAVLDFWRFIIPVFNPSVTSPEEIAFPVRIAFLAVGMVLTSLAVALFFQTYLYPQVYDFFVKGVSTHYKLNRTKFKTCFDFSCLAVACIMTLLFFKKFVGIGVGTIIMTVFNGTIIGFFSKLFNKYLNVVPLAKSFAEKFEID